MGRFTHTDHDDDEPEDIPPQNERTNLVPYEYFQRNALSNEYQTQNFLPHEPRDIKRSRVPVWRTISIIMILIFLQKYMPPPPPPTNSWNEFFSRSTEGIVASIQHFILLVCYVFTGSIRNFYSDVQISVLGNISESNLSTPSHRCALTIPNDISEIENYLRRHMIGQGEALMDLSATLYSWSQSEQIHDKPTLPLSLLLVGPEGVGKSRTAKYLAKLLLKSCHESDPDHDEDNSMISGFLELDGINFALENENATFQCESLQTGPFRQHCRNDLVTRVLDFILERRDKGAVILLKHTDAISGNRMEGLLKLLSNMGNSLSYEREGSALFTTELRNVVFILTSESGTDFIFEHVARAFHDKNQLNMELASLFQEKYQYYGFHIIAPFWPLQYSEIMDVLNQKILTFNLKYKSVRWKNLEVSDGLKRHLIDPNFIDYTVLKSSFEGEEDSVIFAKRGGHAISIDALIHSYDQYIYSQPNTSQQHLMRFDYSDTTGEIYMSICDDRNTCTTSYVGE